MGKQYPQTTTVVVSGATLIRKSRIGHALFSCLQMIMQRLQKERDGFQEEVEKLHERIEFQQNQISKLQREKENVLSELDLVKERWEKAHNSHQKLTVSTRIAACIKER